MQEQFSIKLFLLLKLMHHVLAEAVCKPPCANDGICVRPNTCDCPIAWTGKWCQQVVTSAAPLTASTNPTLTECVEWPSAPDSSTVRCSTYDNCELKCNGGYFFPTGENIIHYRCQDGDWKIDSDHPKNYDQCKPECKPACSNGGNCIRPNTCDCPIGWSGTHCQQDIFPNSNDSCILPSGETGIFKPLEVCSLLAENLDRQRPKIYSFQGSIPIVCCPLDPVENITNLLTRLEERVIQCGQTNIAKLHSTLDEKFSKMTHIILSKINTAKFWGRSLSEPSAAPNPTMCLPPFVKKLQVGCVYIYNTAVSWRKAKVKCKTMGGQLIMNPPLATLLYYITKEGHGSTDFWIGGKYSNYNWRWLDGEKISKGWNDNEPDDNQSNFCVYFNWSGEGLLNDDRCTEKRKFLCEMRKNVQ